MPHAIIDEQPAVVVARSAKTKSPKSQNTKSSSSKELRTLAALYLKAQDQYLSSLLSHTIYKALSTKNRPTVTKIVSLGLGSLKSVNQSRIIKQLAILLAIAAQLQETNPSLRIYAQDPSFTKTDETFLRSLGVEILSTPSAGQVGEAREMIDETTLVYSPFLTLEAYGLFFESQKLGFFIGDDFDALRTKFPKKSAGWMEVDGVWRKFVSGRFQKRALSGGEGFWDAEEKPFPMAMYWSAAKDKQPKARL